MEERSTTSPGRRSEYEILRREGPKRYDIWHEGRALG